MSIGRSHEMSEECIEAMVEGAMETLKGGKDRKIAIAGPLLPVGFLNPEDPIPPSRTIMETIEITNGRFIGSDATRALREEAKRRLDNYLRKQTWSEIDVTCNDWRDRVFNTGETRPLTSKLLDEFHQRTFLRSRSELNRMVELELSRNINKHAKFMEDSIMAKKKKVPKKKLTIKQQLAEAKKTIKVVEDVLEQKKGELNSWVDECGKVAEQRRDRERLLDTAETKLRLEKDKVSVLTTELRIVREKWRASQAQATTLKYVFETGQGRNQEVVTVDGKPDNVHLRNPGNCYGEHDAQSYDVDPLTGNHVYRDVNPKY